MYTVKANILFILKIATELLENGDHLNTQYYKEVFRAFKRFNETGEHFYYKVYLSDNDLERFNLKYLFFKNDLQELQTTFEVLRIGDLFKEHELYHDYKKASTFDNLILFKRFLDYDKLYNVIYVNKRQLKFLLDMEKRNKIKWYKKTEEDKAIIKRGCFKNQYIFKLNIQTIEDLEAITLNDFLKSIPLKLIYYYNEDNNKEKIGQLITLFYDKHIIADELKIAFVRHMLEILTPLFEQTDQDQKTTIEDFLMEDFI